MKQLLLLGIQTCKDCPYHLAPNNQTKTTIPTGANYSGWCGASIDQNGDNLILWDLDRIPFWCNLEEDNYAQN